MKTDGKIHLHLLEFDSSSDANYIKDLGEVSFDAKGIAKVKFTTDGIKPELNKLWNERGNYEMFFAAEVKQGAVQFAEVTQKNRGGKTTVYPSKTVSHNGLEKGKFTYIDSKKDITSVRFLKSNGKDAYEIIKYGEKITLKVQTRNLEGTKLKLTLIRNKFSNGLDKFPQNTQVTVKDQKAEWTINTATLKNKIKKKDWTKVAFWQVEITEADGDKFRYPKENARLKDGNLDWQKLITYQSLKLSDTNAMSEFAKTNAPLIIGEPLEVAQAETKECEPLYWGTKFTCQERKKIREIAKRLNCDPNYLTSAMALETGGSFNPAIVNSLGYTGLIQIGSLAATDINRRKGTSITAGKGGTLAKMTVLEQLTYVEYYLEPYKGKLNTLADFYLAILMPVDCGKGYQRNHVVFDKNIELDYDSSGKVIKNTKWVRQRAYAQNPVFHKEAEENGKTYVWEIAEEIEKWYKKGEGEQHSCEQNCPFKSSTNNQQNSKWRDPIDNPEITVFNYYGNNNPRGSSFGLVRVNSDGTSKNHQGLDIFAPKGTPVKACLDGTVVLVDTNAGGFGKFIVIEIKKEDLEASRIEYQLKYTGEKEKGENYGDSEQRFLRYGHLSEISVSKDQQVKAGDEIGRSGNTGNASEQSVKARHLHFEITDAKSAGSGLNNRENPAYYVRLNAPDINKQENNKD